MERGELRSGGRVVTSPEAIEEFARLWQRGLGGSRGER